jgi:chromosome segregation ATPase
MEEFLNKLELVFERAKRHEGKYKGWGWRVTRFQKNKDTLDRSERVLDSMDDELGDMKKKKQSINDEIKDVRDDVKDTRQQKRRLKASKSSDMDERERQAINKQIDSLDNSIQRKASEKLDLRKQKNELPRGTTIRADHNEKYNDDYKKSVGK